MKWAQILVYIFKSVAFSGTNCLYSIVAIECHVQIDKDN